MTMMNKKGMVMKSGAYVDIHLGNVHYNVLKRYGMCNIQSECFKSETKVDICCWTYIFLEMPGDNYEQKWHGNEK